MLQWTGRERRLVKRETWQSYRNILEQKFRIFYENQTTASEALETEYRAQATES